MSNSLNFSPFDRFGVVAVVSERSTGAPSPDDPKLLAAAANSYVKHFTNPLQAAEKDLLGKMKALLPRMMRSCRTCHNTGRTCPDCHEAKKILAQTNMRLPRDTEFCPDDTSGERADFIITAVNSHTALVEACSAFVEWHDRLEELERRSADVAQAAYNEALRLSRAALAAAEPKEQKHDSTE